LSCILHNIAKGVLLKIRNVLAKELRGKESRFELANSFSSTGNNTCHFCCCGSHRNCWSGSAAGEWGSIHHQRGRDLNISLL
jgi:hypothetical protein